MGHVLIVTLGPVQDFIAAARRSRDLWFGSWLLSDLSKATAEALARECGVDSLVFPGVEKLSELGSDRPTSVANKIVVRVPEGKDPAAVAGRGKDGMQARLEGHRKEAFTKIAPEYFEAPTAIAQVSDLIEYSWVSAPERGSDGYADARRRAEALLAQRKNTRLWKPVTWGKDVPKSSIDGERESVLHESLFDDLTPEQIRKRYGVGPTERLCGVGLLKRHGQHPTKKYSHRFLSTGHLAAWPVYKRAEALKGDPELADLWSRYLKVLAAGGVILQEQMIFQGPGWTHSSVFSAYDGSLLFENRLPELFEEVTDENRRKAAVLNARKALTAVLGRIGVTTPLPYYAILVADGDRMGKAIERQTGFREHRNLSRVLDGFAQNARSLVENKHGGELIYSGGDDVLAFVPLHRAVACALELARDFTGRLEDFPTDDEGRTPTLSAGIGISHFMEPLRRALSTARKAEKLAKRDRDSLAVIVDKRSGPPVSVVGPWGALDRQLTDYARMHRKEVDQIPDGAAYELRELARLLDGAEGKDKESLEKLVRKEAERILRRKQPEHGAQQKIEKEVLERLLADLAGMLLRDLADRLIVSRLLAQAADEANAPLEEKQP